MNEEFDNLKQPFPKEVVELLRKLETVSTEECRVAFDIFDNSSPRCQVDELHEAAAIAPGTKEILQAMWRDHVPMQHAKFFISFVKAIEFVVRKERERKKFSS